MDKKTYRHLLVILLILPLLAACTTRSQYAAMRAGLDSLNQRNRNDQPFTVAAADSLVRIANSHGTANDRLLAYYLLGRAYHEQGEAPMALQSYQHAIEQADTTCADCDYYQLSRVYGQAAMLFYYQHLNRQCLSFLGASSKYAWMAKDTIQALVSYEKQNNVYQRLGLLDSAILVAEHVADLYRQHGYNTQAALALANISLLFIQQNNYEKAKQYLALYETEWKNNRNIGKGREIYYYFKGLIFLHELHLDSAEYWFRRELEEGKDYNNQNGGAYGLAMVYEKKHNPDSVAKYFKYSYAMNDSVYAKTTTGEVERIQALYDYTKNQQKAHEQETKVFFLTIMLCVCLSILLLVCLIGYIVYQMINRRRCEVERKYMKSLEIIKMARQDIARLKENKEDNAGMIEDKELLITEQEKFLMSLSSAVPLYKQFIFQGRIMSEEEWILICTNVFEFFPGFQTFMNEHSGFLNDKEYKTCVLMRAGFKPKNISSMLDVSAAYVSKIRSEMLLKLFNMKGNSKIFDERIKRIF